MKDQCIGTISYKRESEHELSIGYRIIEKSIRGRGYGTEILKLFSKNLFETKAITRLSLYIAENNMPSRRIEGECDYLQEGILRQAYFYRGQMHNWVVYGLLRGEI